MTPDSALLLPRVRHPPAIRTRRAAHLAPDGEPRDRHDRYPSGHGTGGRGGIGAGNGQRGDDLVGGVNHVSETVAGVVQQHVEELTIDWLRVADDSSRCAPSPPPERRSPNNARHDGMQGAVFASTGWTSMRTRPSGSARAARTGRRRGSCDRPLSCGGHGVRRWA